MLVLGPIMFCIFLGIRAGAHIDLCTRATYGFSQSIILIAVYENFWSRSLTLMFGDPIGVIRELATLSIAYTLAFTGLTQLLSYTYPRRDTCSRETCATCGYSLRGLTEPRCPECGQPFDRALLQIESDGPDGVKRDDSA